jgi:hypothetical protein
MGIWSKIKGLVGGEDAPPSSAVADDPRDDFLAEAARIVSEIPSATAVRADHEEFAVRFEANGRETVLYLRNIYEETQEHAPEGRAERLRRAVASFVDQPRDAEDRKEAAAQRLIPVLRASSYLGGAPQLILSRPFLPCLVEALVIDLDASMSYLMPANLAEWGWNEAETFENARRFLASCLGDDDVGPYDPEAPYPIWHVATDDDYEPSRLLVPGWLASFEGKVKGKPIAAVPGHRMLVVTGDGDDRAIGRLLTLADAEYRAMTRRISPALYTVDDTGKVVPYLPAREHPLWTRAQLGHVLLAVEEYAQQKQVLDREHGKDGTDVFVAQLIGTDHPEQGPSSHTTWTEGVPSLLPMAERVTFVGGDGEGGDTAMLTVPWAAVEELAGDCWEPVEGMFPPRMRTKGWPSGTVVERLRQRAV